MLMKIHRICKPSKRINPFKNEETKIFFLEVPTSSNGEENEWKVCDDLCIYENVHNTFGKNGKKNDWILKIIW